MMRYWLSLAALVVAADQVTKQIAARLLELNLPVPVGTFLNFTLAHNTGAAFSFLSSASGWQRWFFVALALAVATAIVLWLRRLGSGERWLGFALSLILGGAAGNVIDRVLYGYVIDFIDVYYTAGACLPLFTAVPVGDALHCHWPAFNVADSAISAGAVMLFLDALRGAKKGPS